MLDWKNTTIGGICAYVNRGISPSYVEQNGISLINQKCIRNGRLDLSFSRYTSKTKNYTTEKELQTNDILINSTGVGTAGRVALFNKKSGYYVDTHVSIVRINPKIAFPKFIFYNLFKRESEIESYAEGSTGQIELSREKIKEIEIVLPPLPEQQAIAEVLSSLDDKIDLLHRNNKTLEEMAETLFRQWFVEGAKEDWEDYPLDKLADYVNGLALQKFPAEKGQPTIPAIKIREMNQGITESTDRVSTKIPEKYLVHNGDILFSWSGSLDVIIWSQGIGALNQHLFKVIPINLPKWLVYFATRLFLPDFRDIANDKATTMGHIQRHHLSDAKIKLPNLECIPNLDKAIDPIFTKLLLNKEQIHLLKSHRDTLLPKLMSGQVVVR